MELDGRVALVTGAGTRVGRVIALALGKAGMRVGVHYAGSQKGARQTADEITAAGSEARTLPGDLTDPATAPRLVEHTAKVFGQLDVLVNSAAVMLRTPVGEVLVEDWDAMFALNLRAPFFLSQSAARVMGERGGAIVNIADLAAFETWRNYVPHAITKAGIVQMTRGLAHALAPKVRVNAIAPGPVLLPDGWTPEQTEKLVSTTPLGRIGSPEDVAQAVLYLLSADYVTGETIIVDGGRHVRT
ncbi:MAG TPA: SDR family oxidoreductase [Gemmatimonadaceae bacterium]|nr:SDR family oxidoreductase [Gemmatimonadaceae bacterium]